MHLGRISAAVIVAAVCAALAPWATARIAGQSSADRVDIPSLTDRGDGLTIRLRNEQGTARFASAQGRGLRLGTADGAAEARARAFVRDYGAPFGITGHTQLEMRRGAITDAGGVEHVRFEQQHLGVPVFAGEFLVHLRGARVLAANGHLITNLPASVAATLPAASARATAERLVARLLVERRNAGVEPGDNVRYTEPRLEIVDPSLFGPTTVAPALAWFIEARATALREWIWVDAQNGTLLHQLNQLAGARQREVFNLAGASTPPASPARTEGTAAVGNADVDNAYDFSGATYDYFLSAHGRDSFDNAGATVTSMVHYQTGYAGAFWNAEWLVFGDGYPAAEDIVGHEFTHGVIDRTAALLNLRQSGALAESYADIFGETVDLLDVTPLDSNDTRWDVGEDQPVTGALRNMADPTLHLHPGRMSDSAYFDCSVFDSTGGVDVNSGVPNHAYALMTDGGTYNGRTVAGIGLTKAGAVEYRALTTYLTAGATFRDNFAALIQACADLVGTDGMTAADCTQVRLALEAVEMNQAWPCGAVPPPPLCPNTAAPVNTVFLDGFESGAANWTFTSLAGGSYSWEVQSGGRTGVRSLYGIDPDAFTVHAVALQAGVVVPAGARLSFDHNFEFDASGQAYDGGLIEYSINGGSSWLDAGSLIEAGRTYNATLSNNTGTPAYHGRPAYSYSSQGYTGSRLNLSSLAGQTVMIRFVVATDADVGNLGWEVDNVRLYQCQDAVTTSLLGNGDFSGGVSNWLTYSPNGDMVSNVSGGVFQWYRPGTQAVVFQESGIGVPLDGPLEAAFDIGNSTTVRKRMSVLVHNADFSDLAVCTFTLEPGASLATYRMRTHTTKAWSNATISFYAANTGNEGGGYYRLDNVSLTYAPSNSSARTDCIDPTAPGTGGGEPMSMLLNGNFAAGEGSAFAPWFLTGGIDAAVSSGVMEVVRTSAGGALTQYTNLPLAADTGLGLTFRLGNSSAVRQRITTLIVDSNFSDVLACTFWVPPGQALNSYAMRVATTKPWSNAAVGFYPSTAATLANPVDALHWLRLDDVVLTPTGTTPLGTECFEPGSTPVF